MARERKKELEPAVEYILSLDERELRRHGEINRLTIERLLAEAGFPSVKVIAIIGNMALAKCPPSAGIALTRSWYDGTNVPESSKLRWLRTCGPNRKATLA